MALVLTGFGESRGVPPPDLQMSAVMKVIENRTEYGRKKYPHITELDVVLQNINFSMYNEGDPNWRDAIGASRISIKKAIQAYVDLPSRKFETNAGDDSADKVYHYAEVGLCSSGKVNWVEPGKEVSLTIDGQKLPSAKGHLFYQRIPWTFVPTNKYKDYAKKNDLLK
jgi:hypothetical protein